MKLVLADNISPYVDRVFAAPAAYTGGHFVAAAYLFIYQVFCDFAGYSSIAIGVARMMGYDLMQNFRRPFFARSWAELWTRWHMSLMTWFRDYIYKSLRNKQSGPLRPYVNLFVVFLASGLWHGAAWTFVIWGMLNWVVMAAERAINNWSWAKRIKRPAVLDRLGVARVVESLAVVTLFAGTGIFFRARSLADAVYIFRHLGDIPRPDLSYLASLILPFTSDYSALAFGLFLLAGAVLLETVHLIQENRVEWVLRRWRESALLKGAALLGLLLLILFLGKFDSKSFIYFQF
jgi:alginate O-acetyltransferase complex protein AlgI